MECDGCVKTIRLLNVEVSYRKAFKLFFGLLTLKKTLKSEASSTTISIISKAYSPNLKLYVKSTPLSDACIKAGTSSYLHVGLVIKS